MSKTSKHDRRPLLAVYYDGGDALWRTRIAIYKLEARRASLDIAWHDYARAPEVLDALGLDPADARRRLYAVDGDGERFSGTAALALLWSALPSHQRLGHALASPPLAGFVRACADGPLARLAARCRDFTRRQRRADPRPDAPAPAGGPVP